MKKQYDGKDRVLALLMAFLMVVSMLVNPLDISATSTAPQYTVTVAGNKNISVSIPKYSVSGTVTCGGKAVSGVDVTITGLTSVQTGEDGSFTIPGVAANTTPTITVRKPGFDDKTEPLSTVTADVTNVNIGLSLLQPVIISDKTSASVDGTIAYSVSNVVEGASYQWQILSGNAVIQNNSMGTSIEANATSSGPVNVNVTASYGTVSVVGTNNSVNVNKRQPSVEIRVGNNSDANNGKITELIVTATVGVSEGNVGFTATGDLGHFVGDHSYVSVSNGEASVVYVSNSPDGFGGMVGFSADYSGSAGKYYSNIGSREAQEYKKVRDITFAENDNYGNSLSESTQGETPEVTVEYGTPDPKLKETNPNTDVNYEVKVNKDVSSPMGLDSVYSYRVYNENNPGSTDLPCTVDEKGYVRFTRVEKEDEDIRIEVTRVTPGYADAIKEIKLNITKRQIVLASYTTDGSNSKTYDGTASLPSQTVTFTSSSFKRENSTETAVLPQEAVRIASVTADIITSSADKGTYSDAAASVTSITLDGAHKENYAVSIENNMITTGVTIIPRNYHVRIKTATRPYGTIQISEGNGPELLADTDISIATEGVLNDADLEAIKAGITFVDSSTVNSPMESYNPGNGYYITAQVKDEYSTDNVIGNYKICWDEGNASKGYLTITQEQVNGQYVSFNGYGEDRWIQGKVGAATVEGFIITPTNTTLYNKVVIKPDTDYSVDGSNSNIAYKEQSEGDVSDAVTVTYVLQRVNEAGVVLAETADQTATFKADASVPTVTLSGTPEITQSPLQTIARVISFGTWNHVSYTITADVQDTGSGLASANYAVLDIDKNTTEEELYNLVQTNPLSWTSLPSDNQIVVATVSANIDVNTVLDNKVVLVSVTDNVGNSQIYASNGVVIENYLPVITINGLNSYYGSNAVADGTIFYSISVHDEVEGTAKQTSGIKEITYEVQCNGETISGSQKSWAEQLTNEPVSITGISETNLNSNTVVVQVKATDKAGNTVTKTQEVYIDLLAPSVAVSYDETNAGIEGTVSYFGHDRTATVTIKERNFNPENAVLTYQLDGTTKTQKFSQPETQWVNIALVSDTQDSVAENASYTDERTLKYQLTFKSEGAYTYQVDVADEAGNTGNAAEQDTFVIDKTDSKIAVDYGTEAAPLHETYFKTARTATVTFTERNFDSSLAKIKISGKNEKGNAFFTGEYTLQDIESSSAENPFGGYVSVTKVSDSQSEQDITGRDNNREIKYTIAFNKDANYTVECITCEDLSGRVTTANSETSSNVTTTGTTPYVFTVDKVYGFTLDPTKESGSIIVAQSKWASFLEIITFGIFHKDTVTVNLQTEDEISPVEPILYKHFTSKKTRDELTLDLQNGDGWTAAASDEPNQVTYEVSDDEQFIVYMYAKDYAGNEEFYSSDGVIVDKRDPESRITITELAVPENGIYTGDVKLLIEANDPIVNGSYSGLEIVNYTVTASSNYGEVKTRTYPLMDNSNNRVQSYQNFSEEITISAEEWNSNAITVTAYAKDFSGREFTSEVTELKIDTVDPKAFVSYEGTVNKDQDNVSYYAEDAIATITFQERNFDPEQASVTLSTSYTAPEASEAYEDDSYDSADAQAKEKTSVTKTYKVSELSAGMPILDGYAVVVSMVDTQSAITDSKYFTDERTRTVKIQFTGDADYQIAAVYCEDLSGRSTNEPDENSAVNVLPSYFNIDKTVPKISIAYDLNDATHERYFSSVRTATITFTERNFVPAYTKIKLNAKDVEDKQLAAEEYTFAQLAQQGTSILDGYVAVAKSVQDSQADRAFKTYTDERTVTYVLSFLGDANYEIESIECTDLAHNTVTASEGTADTGYVTTNASTAPYLFTVDKTAPDSGSVTVSGATDSQKNWIETWIAYVKEIVFKWFSKTTVSVTMTGSDTISKVEPLRYYKTTRQMSEGELDALSANQWTEFNGLNIGADQQFVIYEKVTNYAGLYTYFSTDGVVVDDTQPKPLVTITNLSQAQNGIFNENVVLRIDVEDSTEGDTYSGLEHVWYTVAASGNVTQSQTTDLLNNINRVQGTKVQSFTVTIPANVYNSNDVTVKAYATDFSGNTGESAETKLKIDVTNPTIAVSWDLNNPLNGRYYKDTRTATVTITDRNFDPNNVNFHITNTDGVQPSISGWSSSGNIGISDQATSVCTVSFPADGDYTFTVDCVDLAGNTGNYAQTDEFTIDKTIPVICVSYDNNAAQNGNYYKVARTATITITEHNFNAAEVEIITNAMNLGSSVTRPTVSGWSGTGDRHTATVYFGNDADYTFDLTYTDLAGNAAADYAQDAFTVDLTKPDIKISGIENKSANKGVVAPTITISDTNYSNNDVTITLTGEYKGKINVDSMVTRTVTATGTTISFRNFGIGMDDIYTLTVKSTDKSGNETTENIVYSVNRDGSTYRMDSSTTKLLKKGITNAPQNLVIEEINVDLLDPDSIKVTCSKDGKVTVLSRGTDYTVEKKGNDGEWKHYIYMILADCFEEDGNYIITISSVDAAENISDSTKEKNIEFIVDKTAPTIIVSNMDLKRYTEDSHQFTITVRDQNISYVEMYLDGKLVHIYMGDELTVENGKLQITIDDNRQYQNVKLIAYDQAGNACEPVEYDVLVTTDQWTQFYNNKPLFFGSIGGGTCAIGAVLLGILRRRKIM